MIISAIGIIVKWKQTAAISIIGGADGPTSVFVAGKIGSGLGVLVIGLGIIFLLIGLYLFLKNKHK